MTTATSQYPIPNTQYPSSPDPEFPTLNPEPLDPHTLPPLLPPGQLTLLLGEPGTGKSLLALDLASRLTNNAAPPPAPCTPRTLDSLDQIPEHADPRDYRPASAIIISWEDTFDTLKMRLAILGADRRYLDLPDRLSLIPEKPQPWDDVPRGAYRGPKAPEESPLIAHLMKNLKSLENPRLLILDPLPAFLGNADASYNPNIIRQYLDPLLTLAEVHGLSILGITHLNKSREHKSKNPLHQILGSQAYPALARSIYLLTMDNSPNLNPNLNLNLNPNLNPNPSPQNQAHGLQSMGTPRRLLIPLKQNLSPITHALAFQITPAGSLHWDPDPILDHPLLHSHHHCPTEEEVFTQSQLDLAKEFLLESLSKGPIPSKLLLQNARSLGLPQRTLTRARFLLNIACRFDGHSAQWLAHLPHHQPPDPEYAI